MKLIVLPFILFALAGVGLTLVGAVLAFKASIILGIVALFVEPSPLVFGVLWMCGHGDVPLRLAQWLHLPF